MSVRQYVGARYVPRFSDINGGVWSNVYSYEPLIIVKNGNDYYTSKKSVPVGIQITNTEYWVKTGDYNGAIASLDEKIKNLTNVVENINTRKFLFIGDSYADANNGWVTQLVNILGLQTGEYFKASRMGAGFSNGAGTGDFTFYGVLNDNLPLISDKESYTDCIIIGGANDAHRAETTTNIMNGIDNVFNLLKANFPNIIRTYVGYCCWGEDTTLLENAKRVCNAYQYSCQHNAVFINNLWDSIHDYSLLENNAGIHPNTNGYTNIAKMINSAINGGSSDYVTVEDNMVIRGSNIIPSSLTWNISESVANGVITLGAFVNLAFSDSPITITYSDSPVEIGTIQSGKVYGTAARPNINNVPVTLFYKDGSNKRISQVGQIFFSGKKMLLILQRQTEATSLTGVWAMNFNISYSIKSICN